MAKNGIVYLIGAGPGNPGLLTIKGKKILQSADVIVFDNLINEKLLKISKPNAEIVYVGKRKGHKEYSQKQINKLLINKARKGKTVARLKGGDPFVFGRGGEEALDLAESEIEFEIIPGVSSIHSVPAYAGIPITHRNYNSSFIVVTGHEDPRKSKSKIPWGAISKIETIIFVMALDNLNGIMKKLVKQGKSPTTPVLVTSRGTVSNQVSIKGTISDISDKVNSAKFFSTPAIVTIGNVVNFKEKIDWYEKKPLYGKTVLNTRSKDQMNEFTELLEEEGSTVIEFPTIEIVPPDKWVKLDNAIKKIDLYDYLVFTSTNGVKFFFSRVFKLKLDSRIFKNVKIICIGEKTAKMLNNFGLNADIVPDYFVSESILKKLKNINLKKKRILLARASKARKLLPLELSNKGAIVDIVECYKTIKPKYNKKLLKEIFDKLKRGDIDIVTFTSSSTVKNFFNIFNKLDLSKRKFLIASIGPITNNTLREFGTFSDISADSHTTEGIVESLRKFF